MRTLFVLREQMWTLRTLQARSPLTWIKWSIATMDSFAPSKARRAVPARAGTRSRDRKHSRPAPSTASEGDEASINPLLKEIRHNPLLWLLAFVPVLFVAQSIKPHAHTLLFALSVLAIVPLAGLLSHATESVAAKTGDTVGGLLNATLGNLTELVIALTALHAGQYTLVKASIAGAIVTNTLFMLGMSFLLGGLKHHVQEYDRGSARLQASLLTCGPLLQSPQVPMPHRGRPRGVTRCGSFSRSRQSSCSPGSPSSRRRDLGR